VICPQDAVGGGVEQTPVEGAQVPALWQESGAEQVTALPPTQAPAWHVSVWVQAFPSLQVAPFVLAGFEHVPVAGLQVPTSWHWSCAVQVTGAPPVQTPVWQVSVWVQALPSLQVAPLAFAGLLQPVVGLQVPAVWHWSEAVQVTVVPPPQTPDVHVSLLVQALPSLQVAPLAFAGLLQVPVPLLQTPTSWHWSCAVQVTGLAPVQTPA
jgi:hypothetical protein